MQDDNESRLPLREEPDIWRLPPLEEVEVLQVHYERPRRHMVRGELRERSEGVEILIHTDAPIPIRALSPALFVGEQQVVENEALSLNDYRFFVPEEQRLETGAPIRLGWVGVPPPMTGDEERERVFRYEEPTRQVSEDSLRDLSGS